MSTDLGGHPPIRAEGHPASLAPARTGAADSGGTRAMRVLVLWADDRSGNLGVRALAQGSRALVHRVWPDAEVVFQNFGGRRPELPIGSLRSLLRERLTGARGTRDWLAGFDLVVDTRSGDSFADIYGARRLRMMSAVAEFATEAGTPVVLGPQTIGPFGSIEGRALARLSLRRAAAVMARDTESARCSASLGRPVDLTTTDVVFALPRPDVGKSRDVVLNISGLLWQPGPHVDAVRYRQVVRTLHRRLLAEGRTVTLLAHVVGGAAATTDDDVPALREFASEPGSDDEMVVPAGLDEVREVVASASVVVGSRMHACLNALSVGTPAVPLAYSRKFAPLLSDLGWTASVDLRTDPDPVAAVLAHLDDDRLPSLATDAVARAGESLAGAGDLLRGVRR